MNNVIVKTSGKRVLYFYDEGGICFKDLIFQNKNPKMIFEKARGDFDVIEMSNNEVGIICQDEEGSIVFLRENGNGYLKSTLLKNKLKKVYDKKFTLHKQSEWITVLYTIENENKTILSYQIVDAENETPYAIDEVADKKYYSFTDNLGNLIVFYNKINEFGYRIFKWSEKEWSEYKKAGEGRIKACINEKNSDVFIVSEELYGEKIIFFEKDNLSYVTQKITETKEKSEDAVIFLEGENIWLVREVKDKLYGLKMNREFEIISGPLFFGNDVYKRKYSVKTTEDKYIINECFGYEKNNIPTLIVYKDLYNTSVVELQKTYMESGEEICDFAGIESKKESKEEIEINKLKIRINEAFKRISRIENYLNNQ